MSTITEFIVMAGIDAGDIRVTLIVCCKNHRNNNMEHSSFKFSIYFKDKYTTKKISKQLLKTHTTLYTLYYSLT